MEGKIIINGTRNSGTVCMKIYLSKTNFLVCKKSFDLI